MSIEQLDLLLCDTYQMDEWFPFGWKWKKNRAIRYGLLMS